jgi:hypothetical protein
MEKAAITEEESGAAVFEQVSIDSDPCLRKAANVW